MHDLKLNVLNNFFTSSCLQLGKNTFQLSQRKQHRCGPSSEQSTEDSSTTDYGVQTYSIVTTSVGMQTGPTSDEEADVELNLISPTAGSQIPIKYFFSKQFVTLAHVKRIGNWFLISGIQIDQIQLVKVCDGQKV